MWFILALMSAVFAALTSILAKVGIDGVNSNLATAIRTVVVVVKVSEEYGVSISQCCGSMSLEEYGIDDRGCFDSAWMNSLNIPYDTSSSHIRRGCRCVKSIDIGQYDTCLHDCAYCYANSIERSSRVSRTYDPGAEMLRGDVMSSDTVVDLRSRDVARLDEFVHNV